MSKLAQKLKKWKEQAKFKKDAYFNRIWLKFKNDLENTKKNFNPWSLGDHRLKTVALVSLIAFTGFVLLFQQNYSKIFFVQKIPIERKSSQEIEREQFKKELSILLKDHPIERMIPYIAQKDRKTAAYLVAIAKKESNWGKRIPVLAGQDCYNYWGFRLERERMGSGGHTCFDSPREAVNVVSRRIAEIIKRNDAQSAKDLLVWKCGTSCALTGGQVAANKWASDVDFYAQKVLN